jgi:3-oxoacyl-[acyl-carrier protein] reductase
MPSSNRNHDIGEKEMEPRTALVTGSSSGIGKAIARQLIVEGWRVILHGRTQSPQLASTRGELVELGGAVESMDCDFSQTESLDPFVTAAWERFGRIDAWINNAGADVLTGAWVGKSLNEKLQHLLQVDVTATLILSRSIGNRMLDFFERQRAQSEEDESPIESGHFSILNMGWDQAEHGMGGESGELFATTKGAIMAMTRSLAQSFAPAVRVNCLAPGWIQTAWGEQASDYWDQRAKRESLMNRWGRAEDVAQAACFLCSDQAFFISGQILPINGGFRYSYE